MCGISGIFDLSRSVEQPEQLLLRLSDRLYHRGPDASGTWSDPDAGIYLAHTRLSIIDLSDAGAQPMHSASSEWILSYNGELYNTAELRAELCRLGVVFRGHSDTEVLIESIAAWGFGDAIKKLSGIFALAAWNRRERSLYLCRDHVGVKPLYWYFKQGRFIFSSEFSGLIDLPQVEKRVDRNAVMDYLQFGYVPAPKTIIKHVNKMQPGKWLRISAAGVLDEFTYWDLAEVSRAGVSNPWKGSISEAEQYLDQLLETTVSQQMVSDVPLGAFLSGGIDSSVVVANMVRKSPIAVKTYAIGFEQDAYDESGYARQVAEYLGVDHTEYLLQGAEVREMLPELIRHCDEPFADSSMIPTYLVSKLARRDVTVVLSGDGGDELFAGYQRYILANQAYHKKRLLPARLQSAMASAAMLLSEKSWDQLARLIPAAYRPKRFGMKMHRLAHRYKGWSRISQYMHYISLWHPAGRIAAMDNVQGYGLSISSKELRALPNYVSMMQYVDTLSYLPDDILYKVDRASMLVSLESRVPLLDPRVIEFAWRLPGSMKLSGGVGKVILRNVLYKLLPRQLVDRPKMGFGLPLDDWLRDEVKEWASDYLSEEMLGKIGVFDVNAVQQHWQRHMAGENDQYRLWNVLMLQTWFDRHGLTL